ncbi:MAG TPA: hypothetical protein DDX92_04785 [Flavobacteriales bacterium]|jgi:CysZ protein|nr:hypothetical protein [Flavobacteriales bacterium]
MFPLDKTLQSFSFARLWSILFITAFLTLIILLSLVFSVAYVSSITIDFEPEWIEKFVESLIAILSGVASWFLLPVLMPLIAGFFEAVVVRKVENVYYSEVQSGSAETFWSDLWYDIKFTFKALIINILILPFYLIGIGFIVSIVVNSYLLGMEFFVNVASYDVGKRNARDLFNENRIPALIGGLVFTLLSLIPVVNLFVPIFAIVWMVHLYRGYIQST